MLAIDNATIPEVIRPLLLEKKFQEFCQIERVVSLTHEQMVFFYLFNVVSRRLTEYRANENYIAHFANYLSFLFTTYEPYNFFDIEQRFPKYIGLNNLAAVLDKSNQTRILELFDQFKAYFNQQCFILLPKPFWQRILRDNDTATLSRVLPFIHSSDREEIYRYAYQNCEMASLLTLIDYENSIHFTFHIKELKQIGCWPLSSNLPVLAEPCYQKLETELAQLRQELLHHFPVDLNEDQFSWFFPFTNEDNHSMILADLRIIYELRKINRIPCSNKKRIQAILLFGESNLLNMIPDLVKLIDKDPGILLLADIEPRQHRHLRFLQTCLLNSNSPEQFRTLYFTNNPIINESIGHPCNKEYADKDYLTHCINNITYLDSNNEFLQLKAAFLHINPIIIKLNLLNAGQCERFAHLFKRYHAELMFCNFTNIHDYDKKKQLASSLSNLLPKPENCFFMYAQGEKSNLETVLEKGGREYIARHASDAIRLSGQSIFKPKKSLMSQSPKAIANNLLTN